MFGFYFGFVAVSLSLTYGWLTCPIEFSVRYPGQRGDHPATNTRDYSLFQCWR